MRAVTHVVVATVDTSASTWAARESMGCPMCQWPVPALVTRTRSASPR